MKTHRPGVGGLVPVNLSICLVVGGAITFSPSQTVAQITPDATLGVENSIVTPNVNVRELPADRIDGGAVRGTNLFHSYQEFNVGDGQRVYFANPIGIENILSRVTGNNLSNILGTLGVDDGMVDIFALNHANSGFFSGGDMVLRSPNSVMGDAHYTTGGNFRSEQLTLVYKRIYNFLILKRNATF